MTREQEFSKVKQIIKENLSDGDCGLFDTRNCIGDSMVTIFEGEYFTLDVCYDYSYFEVFGTTDEEFKELDEYYEKL